MDRTTFQKVLLTSTAQKRTKYEKFLKKVQLLESLDDYERGTIADVLEEKVYEDGAHIITEGDVGDSFYIIVNGKAKAVKILEPNHPPVKVFEYEAGAYFGELALINNAPRAASIIAVGQATVVAMDKGSFTRLLGPVESLLKRKVNVYDGKTEEAKRSLAAAPPPAPADSQ